MNENIQFRTYFYATLAALVAFTLVAWTLIASRNLISPVMSALLVAYLLHPVVNWTSKIGISKWLTVGVLILVMGVLTVMVIYNVVPAINREVKVFSDPTGAAEIMSESNLLNKTRELSEQLTGYGLLREPWTREDIREAITTWVTNQRSWILGGLGDMAVRGGQFLMIFFFVLIFALIDGATFYKTAIQMMPNHLFEAGIYIVNRSAAMFGYYLRGVVVETGILFVISAVLLVPLSWISDVTFVLALAIATVFAVTNIVRIVGPIFGAVVGVVIVLTSTTDVKVMLWVLAAAAIVQILDNMVVLPLVMEEQVNIHPVMSMVGVLAGGAMGGVLGMIMAIPVIAGIKIAYQVVTVDMKRFQSKPRDYGLPSTPLPEGQSSSA